jgi:V8-like Glu-specific endopeptidase
VSVLRLDPPVVAPVGLSLAGHLPIAGRGRVLVIGHPDKGDLGFSIMDNTLLAVNDRLLHYRAPTEGGSSGSPVFNMDWKVIGLHHAGGSAMPRLDGQAGTYEANEGLRMDRIVAAARAARSRTRARRRLVGHGLRTSGRWRWGPA